MTAVATNSRMEPETSPLKHTKPVIVASDGSDAALAAIRAAELISARTGCTVRIVSALEPLPVVVPPADRMVFHVDWERIREKGRHDILAHQLKALGIGSDWAVDVCYGNPSEAIASYARAHNAGLIIVGSNKHGMIERMLGEDTALDIARISEVPLLIATFAMTRLAAKVVIAMDLGPDGMQDMAETLSLVSHAPTISCAHVQPRDESLGVNWAEYDREYQFAMTDRFANVKRDLSAAGFSTDFVSLRGDPSKEIVEFAERSRADLIAIGINRKIGKTRAIGGRTARRIIRHAGCSVLIVPRFLLRKAQEKLPGATDVMTDSRAWDFAMREFTKRNAGRIGSLEVDDAEMGANMEARNYPLIGVDYDHRDECLTIILGDIYGTERHLTRTILKPKTVSILSGKRGDSALCVTHNGGQTLMTF